MLYQLIWQEYIMDTWSKPKVIIGTLSSVMSVYNFAKSYHQNKTKCLYMRVEALDGQISPKAPAYEWGEMPPPQPLEMLYDYE